MISGRQNCSLYVVIIYSIMNLFSASIVTALKYFKILLQLKSELSIKIHYLILCFFLSYFFYDLFGSIV